jgi:hypothetical protein
VSQFAVRVAVSGNLQDFLDDFGPSRRALDRYRDARGVVSTVNELSVVPCTDVFCMIMSTLIDLSAKARNSLAAIPGRSRTPLTLTLASELSSVTADLLLVVSAILRIGSKYTPRVQPIVYVTAGSIVPLRTVPERCQEGWDASALRR